jgi:hypothetical protein
LSSADHFLPELSHSASARGLADDLPYCVANPRAATIVTCAITILAAVVTILSPVTTALTPVSAIADVNAAAAPARIVDAPAPDGSCKDQTWPYIDSHCLKRAENPAVKSTEVKTANVADANTRQLAPANPQTGSGVALPAPAGGPQPEPSAQSLQSGSPSSLPRIATTRTERTENLGIESGVPVTSRAESQAEVYSERVIDVPRRHSRHSHTFRLFGFRF